MEGEIEKINEELGINELYDSINLFKGLSFEMDEYFYQAFDDLGKIRTDRVYIVNPNYYPRVSSYISIYKYSIYPPNLLSRLEEVLGKFRGYYKEFISKMDGPNKKKMYDLISIKINGIDRKYRDLLFRALRLDYLDFPPEVVNEAMEIINKVMQTPKNPS